MKIHAVFALVLALGLQPFTATVAADKPKAVIGKASDPMLSKEQLRSCINQKAGFAAADDALKGEQTALLGVKDELARSGDALKTRLETLDRSSAEAVAAYNDELRARDKQVDAYQARANAFNTRVDARGAEREAYAKACENRRYLEDDEIAIKKGK